MRNLRIVEFSQRLGAPLAPGERVVHAVTVADSDTGRYVGVAVVAQYATATLTDRLARCALAGLGRLERALGREGGPR